MKEYMVCCSLTAYVLDALLGDAELEKVLLDEITWLEGVSSYTWERLARLVGDPCATGRLRDQVACAAHVSASFIQRRVFDMLRGWPWKLAAGDIEDNLHSFQQHSESTTDACTHKAQELLRIGFNKNISEAVALLREVQWSTLDAEQAHGSCAAIHKYHRLYTIGQLPQRASLHQARRLFTMAEDDRMIERKWSALERLQRRRPMTIGARQAFMARFMQCVRHELLVGHKMSAEARQEIMGRHSQLFDALSPEEVSVFAREGDGESLWEKKERDTQGERSYLSAPLRLASQAALDGRAGER